MRNAFFPLTLLLAAHLQTIQLRAADEAPANKGAGEAQTVEAEILIPRIARSEDPEASVPELEKSLRRLPTVKLIPHSSATPMVVVQFDPAFVFSASGGLGLTIGAK